MPYGVPACTAAQDSRMQRQPCVQSTKVSPCHATLHLPVASPHDQSTLPSTSQKKHVFHAGIAHPSVIMSVQSSWGHCPHGPGTQSFKGNGWMGRGRWRTHLVILIPGRQWEQRPPCQGSQLGGGGVNGMLFRHVGGSARFIGIFLMCYFYFGEITSFN